MEGYVLEGPIWIVPFWIKHLSALIWTKLIDYDDGWVYSERANLVSPCLDNTLAHFFGPRVLIMTMERCVLEGPIRIAPIWYNTFALLIT